MNAIGVEALPFCKSTTGILGVKFNKLTSSKYVAVVCDNALKDCTVEKDVTDNVTTRDPGQTVSAALSSVTD